MRSLVVVVFGLAVPCVAFDLMAQVQREMNKDCEKNGTSYRSGQLFAIGHMRYKCEQFGVYSIIGCQTESGKSLDFGDAFAEGSVATSCIKSGNQVSFRQMICGIMGQPSCDSIIAKEQAEQAKNTAADSEAEKAKNAHGHPRAASMATMKKSHPIAQPKSSMTSMAKPKVHQKTSMTMTKPEMPSPMKTMTRHTTSVSRHVVHHSMTAKDAVKKNPSSTTSSSSSGSDVPSSRILLIGKDGKPLPQTFPIGSFLRIRATR